MRAKLVTLNTALLPRSEYSVFAGFARRAGAPSWALRLLNPVIHSEDSLLQDPASPAEIASYALALSATGALSEANKLIKQIENVDSHETLQACAYVSIWGWEYSKAVGFLKRYIRMPGLSDFQVALAQINLASSHEFVGHKLKAAELVAQILPAARRMKWSLLERDALLLSAQLHIADEDWKSARSALSEALALSEKVGLDPLLANKWEIILEIYQSPQKNSLKDTIENLKAKARAGQRWEIVRDADYHYAKVLKDKSTLDRLYFGTPFASFRKRLLVEAKSFWAPEAEYLWQPAGGGGNFRIHMTSGEIEGPSRAGFKNDLCLSLLRILTSDFYRPFKRGSLFAELYPDKHYDVLNASYTIANVIQRLRKTIQSHRLPLQIKYANHQYRLWAETPVDFVITNSLTDPPQTTADDSRTLMAALKQRWPYQTFTSRQAAELLSIPPAQARKLVLQAMADQKVVALGETKSRLYRFKK